MRLVEDSRGRAESPLLHLVTSTADGPGGHAARTLCGQGMITLLVWDRDLSDYDLTHLCSQCQRAAKISQAAVVAAAEREAGLAASELDACK
jgi:hypothetical protein